MNQAYTGDDLRDDCNVARTKLLDGAIKMSAGMLLGQYITDFRNNLLFAGNDSMCQPLLAMYCFKCNHPGHLTNHPCPFRHFTAVEARRRSGYPHPPEGAKKPGQAKSKPPSESGASESDLEPEPQPPPKAAKPRDQGMRRGVSRAQVVPTPLSAKTAAKWLKEGGIGVVALVSYENLQDPPGVPPEQAAQLRSLLMELSDVFEPITGREAEVRARNSPRPQPEAAERSDAADG
ncbi:hypothetical protein QJQ45_029532 [Haematococcus lacustris]|nr:hypothetical protein QJQ45_029532 [Haematococcus lacustris]